MKILSQDITVKLELYTWGHQYQRVYTTVKPSQAYVIRPLKTNSTHCKRGELVLYNFILQVFQNSLAPTIQDCPPDAGKERKFIIIRELHSFIFNLKKLSMLPTSIEKSNSRNIRRGKCEFKTDQVVPEENSNGVNLDPALTCSMLIYWIKAPPSFIQSFGILD